MIPESAFSQIQLSNLPHVNVRTQFRDWYGIFHDEEFLSGWSNWRAGQWIETPTFRWYGFPDEFYTLALQQAILGLESYVSGAVYFETGFAGMITPELAKQIRNPFLLPGRGGTARRFYVMLPAVLSETLSLDRSKPDLWPTVKDFYRAVRNPLFHGRQISSHEPRPLRPAFQLIADVYAWIDSWHDPKSVLKAWDRIERPSKRADKSLDAPGTPVDTSPT
jgi:hypothetical protein